MNYTNETPVCQHSICKCEGRDTYTAYIAFSIAFIILIIIQIVITCGGLIWANLIIKNKEWKNEKERNEREARDKIAEIVSSEYCKIENKCIDVYLQKCKEKFKSMIIFSDAPPSASASPSPSPSPITGLDVLKYMCHPDNYPNHQSKMLGELHSDLEAVVSLFKSFRIKLPLKGICPDNIREELGPPIIKLGEITASFVSGKKNYTISKVMKYFGSNMKPATSTEQQQRIDAVKRKIPYIGDLCFGEDPCVDWDLPGSGVDIIQQSDKNDNHRNYHDTDFTLKYKPLQGNKEQQIITSNLKQLAIHLREKMICNTDELAKIGYMIEKIWIENEQLKDIPRADYRVQDKLRVNILHAVCVLWFLVTDDGGIICDEQFKSLVGEMFEITNVQDSDVQHRRSSRAISKIQKELEFLSTSRSYMYLLEQKTIADKLENIIEDLSTSIREHMPQ